MANNSVIEREEKIEYVVVDGVAYKKGEEEESLVEKEKKEKELKIKNRMIGKKEYEKE